MVVEKIYQELKGWDIRLSKSKFSREYLNKDRNYWFVCNYNKTDISNDALLSLYGNLRRYGEIWMQLSEDKGSHNRDRYQRRYRFMLELADVAMEEIERRALN